MVAESKLTVDKIEPMSYILETFKWMEENDKRANRIFR
jgi:hypothetical protein